MTDVHAMSATNITGCLSSYPGWRMLLRKTSRPWLPGASLELNTSSVTAQWVDGSDGVSCRFACHDTGITVELCSRLNGNGTVWTATIVNDSPSDWTVREFTFPVFEAVPDKGASLLWPQGLGQRFIALRAVCEQHLYYPSAMAPMPWFALSQETSGIYFGSHDPEFSARRITARSERDGSGLKLSWMHYPFCAPGSQWSAPPLHVTPYRGTWHTAARLYRAWFDSVARVSVPPAWVQDCSGWLLAVLKQQNGLIMWDYRTGIDRLCDVAEQRGLNVLGLFGWAHGGHDALYPDYIPDPLMGGETALREALDRARQRGIRTILYANGCIMDTATEFYHDVGNSAIALREDSEPYVQSIRKFHSATPVTFAAACHGAGAWRERMLALAMQAMQLGADGILFDQVAVTGPLFCFSNEHDHASPATAFTAGRITMMRQIEQELRRSNPEFVIATEGVVDALSPSIQLYHGWGYGFGPHQTGWDDPRLFPELVRYTFPEWVLTNRYAQPALDNRSAAYALLHGLRLELETRYPADVNYLLQGRVPSEADYADVAYWPPIPTTLGAATSDGSDHERRRMLALMGFQQRHGNFLLRGRFQDVNGFTLGNPCLQAKAFASDAELGILIWNPTECTQPVDIVTPSRQIHTAYTQDGKVVDAHADLPPYELRLVIAEGNV